jgi:hypothetical protein
MKLSVSATAAMVPGALAQGMLRFGCSQLVIERIDPIVNPGQDPSSHTHQVVGGNSFNITVGARSLLAVSKTAMDSIVSIVSNT